MTSIPSFSRTQNGVRIVMMTCASVSFLASSFICGMLVWAYFKGISRPGSTSNRGERCSCPSTPYRRIIFGLSISNVILSFALLTGPVSVPAWIPHSWGQGNSATCQANGFLLTFGGMALPMYTCFLCLYNLCKLKYRMTDESFYQKIEKYLHIFIVIFNIALSIAALASDTFHTAGIARSYCHFATVPNGCRYFPDLVGACDPISKIRVDFFLLVCGAMTILLFLGIIVMMCMLFCHAHHLNKTAVLQEAQRKEYSKKQISQLPNNSPSDVYCETSNETWEDGANSSLAVTVEYTRSNTVLSPVSKKIESTPPLTSNGRNEASQLGRLHRKEAIPLAKSTLSIASRLRTVAHPGKAELAEKIETVPPLRPEDEGNEASEISSLYRRETLLQATCYVGAFCCTYSLVVCGYIKMTLSSSFDNVGDSNYNSMVSMGMFSLGGIFNILAYTRSNVASLRRRHPEYSRLYCLWIVLKACGEIPEYNSGGADSDLSLSRPQDEEFGEVEGSNNSSTFSFPVSFESIRTPSLQISEISDVNPISMENAKSHLGTLHRRELNSTENIQEKEVLDCIN